MKEVKDPEIKLFGKKIALPENGKVLVISGNDPGGEFIDTSSDSDRSLMIKANTCLEHKKVRRVGGEGKLEQVTEKVWSQKTYICVCVCVCILLPVNLRTTQMSDYREI